MTTVDTTQTVSTLPTTPQEHEYKQQYLHHQSIVEALCGKDLLYQTAHRRAVVSAHTAKGAAKTLTTIRYSEKNVADQVETIRSKRFKRFFFPNHTDQEVARLSDVLSALAEQYKNAKEIASYTRTKAQTDAKTRDSLQGDAELLQTSEESRRTILEEIYGGPDVGTEQENAVETERDNLNVIVSRERDSLSKQNSVLSLLKESSKLLKQSRHLLWDAKISNTVDFFSSGSIGLLAGISTQYRYREASRLAQEAGLKIESASDLCPAIPVSKMTKIHNTIFLSFADVFLDGFVTDLAVRLALDKAVRAIDDVLEKVQESIELQTGSVESLEGSVRRFSADLEQTSDELTRIRSNLFLKAIKE